MSRIVIHNATVEFPVYQNDFKITSKVNKLGGFITSYQNKCSVIRALDNLSLDLYPGDRVGLIGHNGAGKSTLLRLLAGIYEPVSGHVHTEGSIASMLSIAQGIEREATGYENIFIRGTLMGMDKNEIKCKQDEIAEFSELGDYLSMPVHTYSSGMLVRLAFAISTSIQPDILLLDEIFAAGDASFQEKAKEKMASLVTQSKIIVFASHSFELLKEFCNKVLVLETGKIADYGPLQEILTKYAAYNKKPVKKM